MLNDSEIHEKRRQKWKRYIEADCTDLKDKRCPLTLELKPFRS